MLKIARSLIASLEGSLPERVAAFAAAQQAHQFTVGAPAPIEDPLIEAIVRAGGLDFIEIVEAPAAPAQPSIPPPPPSPPLPTRRLAVLEFRGRLWPAERLAITTAGMTVPEIRLWLDDLAGAQYVDLDDARTVDGLQFMVQAGLLTQARVAEILA